MTDMNPNTPNQPQNFDPTRRLKKVKRPIKRYIGQPNPSAPQAPGMQMPVSYTHLTLPTIA